ncbi:hypothetical protein DV515_00011948 [Chloebia gouldiae]|uniref:Uncharacterized protein n=1 Tax=Chloebia gouldiae TaxID=44316 RepID=A0A3L8S532_CHLGU|nr:hypothetical protein DV515_00011948 [Chloebia gouldiae]
MQDFSRDLLYIPKRGTCLEVMAWGDDKVWHPLQQAGISLQLVEDCCWKIPVYSHLHSPGRTPSSKKGDPRCASKNWREDTGEVELLLPVTRREWQLPSHEESAAAAPHSEWKLLLSVRPRGTKCHMHSEDKSSSRARYTDIPNGQKDSRWEKSREESDNLLEEQ